MSKQKKTNNAKVNNAADKVKELPAPIPLTEDEKLHFECWNEMMRSLQWLYATPDDLETKRFISEFLAYYAKIKKAMDVVIEGETKCNLGTIKGTGRKLTICKRFFKDAKGEADFVVPFYMTYLCSKIGSSAMGANNAVVRMFVDSEDRVQELEDEIERKDMRIRDLENAVKKATAEGRRARGVPKPKKNR